MEMEMAMAMAMVMAMGSEAIILSNHYVFVATESAISVSHYSAFDMASSILR